MGGGGRPANADRKDAHDGAFTHDIEINDLRNRYVLTKGSTQAQVCGGRKRDGPGPSS